MARKLKTPTPQKTDIAKKPAHDRNPAEAPEQLSDGHIIPFYNEEETLYQQLVKQAPDDATFLTLGLRAADRLAADLGMNGVHSTVISFHSETENRDDVEDEADAEVVTKNVAVSVRVDPLADPDYILFK